MALYISCTLYGWAVQDAALAFKPHGRMLPGIGPMRGPELARITESRPVIMAAWHFAAICYSSGCGLYQAFRDGLCILWVPMKDTSRGLTDKLYWRRAGGEWHCFRKLAQVRGFVSLCQRQEISFVHGQKISRPEAALRCGLCDEVEMTLRGWEGSDPVSPRRAGSFSR
jgi:hypothetical protein